jgi:ribosomal protein S18 acetylase RimI-like enzyme
MSITIKNAASEDLPEILALQHEAYQSEALLYDDYSIQPLTQSLDELTREYERCTILKAELNGEIIGSVRARSDNNTAFIGKLMVKPRYQNQGLGRQLMQEIESRFPGQRFELFTGPKSEKNIALYEKCGYRRMTDKTAASGLNFVYFEKNR